MVTNNGYSVVHPLPLPMRYWLLLWVWAMACKRYGNGQEYARTRLDVLTLSLGCMGNSMEHNCLTSKKPSCPHGQSHCIEYCAHSSGMGR
eukprot:Nk52_evm1s2481 gene=Nk52_evmTU1s2481